MKKKRFRLNIIDNIYKGIKSGELKGFDNPSPKEMRK